MVSLIPVAPEVIPTEAAPAPAPSAESAVTSVGPLRISTPLFNVYLSEADQWSDQLVSDLAEWGRHVDAAIPERAMARAHSLAGSSATVGFAALSELARGGARARTPAGTGPRHGAPAPDPGARGRRDPQPAAPVCRRAAQAAGRATAGRGACARAG
jgi:hypothetical protein